MCLECSARGYRNCSKQQTQRGPGILFLDTGAFVYLEEPYQNWYYSDSLQAEVSPDSKPSANNPISQNRKQTNDPSIPYGCSVGSNSQHKAQPGWREFWDWHAGLIRVFGHSTRSAKKQSPQVPSGPNLTHPIHDTPSDGSVIGSVGGGLGQGFPANRRRAETRIKHFFKAIPPSKHG